MITKLFEVRDEGTTIPVLAIQTDGNREANEAEAWLWGQAGYYGRPYIFLVHLDRVKIHYDPYGWGAGSDRTMRAAHRYIEKHFDKLASGDVIDVEYILGYKETPKRSERLGEAQP